MSGAGEAVADVVRRLLADARGGFRPSESLLRSAADLLEQQAAQLAEARAALKWIANTGQSIQSDHWLYRVEARRLASRALAHPNTESDHGR